MRISDWSSDVCSSDLASISLPQSFAFGTLVEFVVPSQSPGMKGLQSTKISGWSTLRSMKSLLQVMQCEALISSRSRSCRTSLRSEEHTSELQSLMRNSYAVFCLTIQKRTNKKHVELNNTHLNPKH